VRRSKRTMVRVTTAVLALVVVGVGGVSKMHATFGREHTKALVQRYRPVVHFPDADDPTGAFLSQLNADRYVRAMVNLGAADRNVFGLLQWSSLGGFLLFVCHDLATASTSLRTSSDLLCLPPSVSSPPSSSTESRRAVVLHTVLVDDMYSHRVPLARAVCAAQWYASRHPDIAVRASCDLRRDLDEGC
jgi:hypothetical protein